MVTHFWVCSIPALRQARLYFHPVRTQMQAPDGEECVPCGIFCLKFGVPLPPASHPQYVVNHS
jgi:hypothetical protein